MTQQIGEKESYVNLRINEFFEYIDKELLKPLGLNAYNHESCVEEALGLSYDKLRSIDPKEAEILAIKLNQYSLFIQRERNRFVSKRIFIEEKINLIVGQVGKNYGTAYTKYEERKYMVIADDGFAKALHAEYIKYKTLENELTDISDKISWLSKNLGSIKK